MAQAATDPYVQWSTCLLAHCFVKQIMAQHCGMQMQNSSLPGDTMWYTAQQVDSVCLLRRTHTAAKKACVQDAEAACNGMCQLPLDARHKAATLLGAG